MRPNRTLVSFLVLALSACDPGNEAASEPAKPAPAAAPKPDAAPATQKPTPTPVEPAPGAEGGSSETTGETGETIETGETGEAPATEPDDTEAAKDPPPATKKATTSKAGVDLALGKTAYLAKCKSCHGANGDGKTAMAKKVEIPSLQKTKLSTAKVEAAIRDGVPGTKMKAFEAKLSADELTAVAAFVKTL